jgi:hypothetical protein
MSGTVICDVTDPVEGQCAAEFAHALGARLGLRVVFAFVIDGLAGAVPATVTGRPDVETRIARGDRAEALARIAAEEGADLVVVGARTVGFGGRNLRCELIRDLEAATPVPVLIAPPSTRRRSERRLAPTAQAATR